MILINCCFLSFLIAFFFFLYKTRRNRTAWNSLKSSSRRSKRQLCDSCVMEQLVHHTEVCCWQCQHLCHSTCVNNAAEQPLLAYPKGETKQKKRWCLGQNMCNHLQQILPPRHSWIAVLLCDSKMFCVAVLGGDRLRYLCSCLPLRVLFSPLTPHGKVCTSSLNSAWGAWTQGLQLVWPVLNTRERKAPWVRYVLPIYIFL